MKEEFHFNPRSIRLRETVSTNFGPVPTICPGTATRPGFFPFGSPQTLFGRSFPPRCQGLHVDCKELD